MRKWTLALAFGAVICPIAESQQTTNHHALQLHAQKSRQLAASRKQEARVMARLLGLPERFQSNGNDVELVAFERGRPVYVQTDNANAAISTRANRVHPGGAAGLSLTGSGVLFGVWDGGQVRGTHQEFGGRVTGIDLVGLSDHATHVAGTIIASGVNASAKGMSYQGSVNSYDWNSDDAEMAVAASAGLRLSNHSYGYISGWYSSGSWYWYGDVLASAVEDAGFGFYDGTAQSYDNVAYNAPYYLIVKSAGNDRNQGPASQPVSHYYWDPGTSAWTISTAVRNLDGNGTGYDTVSYNGVAKNIMTVGAVNDVLNYTGPGSVTMSSFSGWGPTDDGRIKPDIVGNGVGLTSSVASSDVAYASYSGTSMSSPNITGSMGLLVQHQRLLFGVDMLAATLKGLVIHSADEAGAATGPDYAFGWGLMNTERAAQTISQDAATPDTITENTLVALGTHTQTVYSDGSGPLRVTICWTDPAGTPPAWALNPTTPMLVNDLDLRVSGPSGTALPFILNPATPSAAATTGDNFRDNVEQVLISAPAAGSYTISVTHKGASLAPAGSQAFSMIVTGNTSAPVPAQLSSLSLAASSVLGGSGTTGTVTMTNTTGGVVNLSSDVAEISVPASATVSAGTSSQTFAVGTATVTSDVTGTITASKDAVTRTATLTVQAPPSASLSTLSLSPTTVFEGYTSTGTVTLTGPAPVGGSVVSLSASAPVSVPATVTVAGGSSTATFTANTGASGTTTISRTVTATLGVVTRTASLTIQPLTPVSLSLSPNSVRWGQTSVGTVTLNAAAGVGGTSVTLTSSNAAQAQVPASVVVPQGATSTTFVVTTSNGKGRKTVTISASRNGVTRSATLSLR